MIFGLHICVGWTAHFSLWTAQIGWTAPLKYALPVSVSQCVFVRADGCICVCPRRSQTRSKFDSTERRVCSSNGS